MSESTSDATATEVFAVHRGLLFSVVYNILGSVCDTEDVLQETWVAWADRVRSPGGEKIANPRAYLVRIAVNRALARQESISRRRETYIGPWLPEPFVAAAGGGPADAAAGDAADAVLRAESVSMALLVVLESLTPLERAVFVLHEVFGYAHPETAEILGRSPAAIRQLAHRAREHVQARRPRHEAGPRLRRQVTERFVAAAAGGDLRALIELLAPDVTLVADGGGKAPAAGRHPVHGRDKVARALAAGVGRFPDGLDIRYRRINGAPSAVFFRGDTLFAALTLDLSPSGEQISGIYLLSNPDKLSHLH
ncbi:RNA polymerase sigma factor SigJ [Streptomyces sp. NBC_01803]|uniref:RNA polymerase sigma factor SigJ n=1 Tax=Streptomyces sp. NBC_01803 TaxID=2975946 RepID=UPI002DDB233C|nr:RNA polymerase sigma factor SigJ [Streptomyces sp. NBC_01803]WSA45441.1 RNA polymerase sigma factor SigJ [Streptomyces sp. NBC_01803]